MTEDLQRRLNGIEEDASLMKRLFPPLNREDRRTLVENLTEGSHWNMNFAVMLGCSVLIAGLGLLQNSVAVIIGAMLVAPLMTPLIGTGLALVQGNFKLLFTSLRSMSFGTGVALLIGVLLQFVTRGSELTLEISNRGAPNLLDLAIAFFAGVAAGYALARPKLSGALPGVAISVALVPPLAASGIALGAGDWLIALGALLLCLVNMVAIVLGSALVFWLHHIKASSQASATTQVLVMRRILMGLGMTLILFCAPLTYHMASQIRKGVARPESLAIPEAAWNKLHDKLATVEGVDFLTANLTSGNRPHDLQVVLSAREAVPGEVIAHLDYLINENMGRDLTVKFVIVQQGEVTAMPESSVPALEKKLTSINE
ncbi:MAG: TIGR00341 family protein [Coraliomargarita sp.]